MYWLKCSPKLQNTHCGHFLLSPPHINDNLYKKRQIFFIRPVPTDFQSRFCIIWNTSAFSSCLPILRIASYYPPFHWDHFWWTQWTVDGTTKGSNASLRSCVGSLLDLFIYLLFLKDITFRYLVWKLYPTTYFVRFPQFSSMHSARHATICQVFSY